MVSMTYNWSNPTTYLVFVPIVSLIVQKFQLIPVSPHGHCTPVIADQKARTFLKVCKWHLRGSLVQTLFFIATAIKINRLPFPLLVLGLFSTFEHLNTAYIAINNPVVIYKFFPDERRNYCYSIDGCTIF
jgi:hypothetical protein